MNKSMMWILVVVALVVGVVAGYAYASSKTSEQTMMVKSEMQKQVDDLKMKNEELMKNDSMGSDTMMSPTPTESMMMHDTTPTDAMGK